MTCYVFFSETSVLRHKADEDEEERGLVGNTILLTQSDLSKALKTLKKEDAGVLKTLEGTRPCLFLSLPSQIQTWYFRPSLRSQPCRDICPP